MKEKNTNPNIDVLPLATMILEDYQRDLDLEWAKAIADNFSEDMVGPLVVHLNEDGQYAVLDGSHRRWAMMTLNHTDAFCLVLTGMTYEERAAYFRKQNKSRKQPTTYDDFKAGLKEKDPVCMAINSVAAKNDFTIGKNAGQLRSIQMLILICKTYGVMVLDSVLKLIGDTWRDEHLALRREFLGGVAEFVKRFGPADFVERMSNCDVRRIWRTYNELCTNAIVSTAASMRKAFCFSLVQHYNAGLRRNSPRFLRMEDYYENLA